MSNLIKDASTEIALGIRSERECVVPMFLDGKRGPAHFVLPLSNKLMEIMQANKNKGDLCLINILNNLGDFVAFAGMYDGQKQYLIITEDRQIGFTHYPRYLLPKAFYDSTYFSSYIRNHENEVKHLMMSNGIPYLGVETVTQEDILREVFDIDITGVDYLADLSDRLFKEPLAVKRVRTKYGYSLKLIIPNTESLIEDLNENGRTNKWLVSSITKKWAVLKTVSGKYIADIDFNTWRIDFGEGPMVFIMNELFYDELGLKLLKISFFDNIVRVLGSMGEELDFEEADSLEMYSVVSF